MNNQIPSVQSNYDCYIILNSPLKNRILYNYFILAITAAKK